MTSHQRFNRRSDLHQQHARVVMADSPHAFDAGDLRPRFSPTAIFPTASSAPTAAPIVPTDTSTSAAATSSSGTSVAVTPPADTSSSSTPATTSTTPTTTSTTPTTPTATATTSTSTSSSSSALALPTTLATSTSSTSSLSTSITPVLIPTSSVPTFSESNIVPATSSIASSATPSATPTSSGGTSTSVVVGCIAASLVGLAGLIFAIMFFLRRWRKRGEEEQDFNAEEFRRQSAILVDDEGGAYRGGDGQGGFNPRPPTMIERHMANRTQFGGDVPPMPSLQQYNNLAAGGAASGYGNQYDHPISRQPSFSPGQVMPSINSPPPSATGAQFPMANGQSPAPYDSAYNPPEQAVRHPSMAAAMFDQYGNPLALPPNGPQGDLGRQNSAGGNAHYADLTRSSVTPFQAAQYAEISRQLNEPSAALQVVNENEEPNSSSSDHTIIANQSRAPQSTNGGDDYLPSPFEDPQIPAEVHQYASVRSDQFLDAQQAPQPVSPIYSLHSQITPQERPLSDMPSLPEIQVPDRTFSPTSYDFPQTPSARPTPSPSHTNFSIPAALSSGGKFSKDLAPSAAESARAPAAPEATVPQPTKQEVTPKQSTRPTSTYTVYDEADAYGGF